MPAARIPDDEERRLSALRRCGVLDTDQSPAFDGIAKLARSLFGTPMAFVSLVDQHRQWFKSHIGLSVCETPREYAFCAHAILSPDPLVVPDATRDPRFAENPLVTGDPNIRFYAGAPIRLSTGETLGTVCVIDTIPRTVDAAAIEQLTLLADQTAALLEASAELRASQTVRDEMRIILDAVPAYVYYKDSKNTILDLNRAAADAIGLPLEEIIGRRTEDFFPEDEAAKYLEDDLAVLESGTPRLGIEEPHEGTHGERRLIQTDKFPLRDESGNFNRLVAIAKDITDLRRAENAIRKKNEELERFVYSVSHDLKSPLLTIVGFAEMGAEGVGSISNDELRACFARIVSAGRRLERIISDLLALSHIDRAEDSREELGLAATLKSVLTSIEPLAENASVTITSDFRAPVVTMARAHLTQVLQNLIVNALRYGGDADQPEVTIGSEQRGDRVRIFVKDNGNGIAPEHHDRIFGLFQRLPSARPGTGLGLAIVRKVAESYGGAAGVESEPGHGATFWVDLPLNAKKPIEELSQPRPRRQTPPHAAA